MKKILLFLSILLISSFISAENIIFKADMMTGNTQSKTKPTKLIGHAYVKTETMEFSADSITMSGEDYRFIVAEGNVKGSNTESQMDFTCGKMKYDRETKIARLEDSVTLKDIQNDVDASAQIIDYNQNSEIAVMQIGVNLKQKDNTCTCAYALYKKNDQMLEMNGNPKIVQGDDTFRAQVITLNLDTQEITLDGRVSGTVTDSKSSAPPPQQNPPAPEEPAAVGIQEEQTSEASENPVLEESANE